MAVFAGEPEEVYRRARSVRTKHRRVIYYSPYADYAARYQFDEPDKVVLAKMWEQVMGYLSVYGSNTQTAVLSDGTISYYRRREERHEDRKSRSVSG